MIKKISILIGCLATFNMAYGAIKVTKSAQVLQAHNNKTYSDYLLVQRTIRNSSMPRMQTTDTSADRESVSTHTQNYPSSNSHRPAPKPQTKPQTRGHDKPKPPKASSRPSRPSKGGGRKRK